MSSYQINYVKPAKVDYVKRAPGKARSLRKGECINLTQAARAMASR